MIKHVGGDPWFIVHEALDSRHGYEAWSSFLFGSNIKANCSQNRISNTFFLKSKTRAVQNLNSRKHYLRALATYKYPNIH
jgi:hypothetical protein